MQSNNIDTIQTESIRFNQLGLAQPVLDAVASQGYETPTEIQKQSIQAMLDGRDMIAQAQTGTGKTAAFALPILSNIDITQRQTQALILAPTRELAIQVCEAFQRYSANLRGLKVIPIYGGQSFTIQLRALEQGPHIIVGTPGRVMDHIRRGKLNLDNLKTLVLDEADEMLNMGFKDDIEWILEQVPGKHQTALFSATLPSAIREIAKRYLTDPVKVHVKTKTQTVETIDQQCVLIKHHEKFEGLIRLLKVSNFDGAIVFSQTKKSSDEIAEHLVTRGYRAAAINGDLKQEQRERVINQTKSGSIDIIVATDVAARGIDIPRIELVVNYDIPFDPESYVHRIGRTGRAGRLGCSVLFVTPREQSMLARIEKVTGQRIKNIQLPTDREIFALEQAKYQEEIKALLEGNQLDKQRQFIENTAEQLGATILDVASAILKKSQSNDVPLTPMSESLSRSDRSDRGERNERSSRNDRFSDRGERGERSERSDRFSDRGDRSERGARSDRGDRRSREASLYRISVGRDHGINPLGLIDYITQHTNLDRRSVGDIHIRRDHTLVQISNILTHELQSLTKNAHWENEPVNFTPEKSAAPAPRERSDRGSERGERGERGDRSDRESRTFDDRKTFKPTGDRAAFSFTKDTKKKSDSKKSTTSTGSGYKSKSTTGGSRYAKSPAVASSARVAAGGFGKAGSVKKGKLSLTEH